MAFGGRGAGGVRWVVGREWGDRELDEELRTYLQMETGEKMKQGMSPEDALRAVRLERGSIETAKEVVRSAGWEFFVQTRWQSVRDGLRRLLKQPAFTRLDVRTLAVGVGPAATLC